MPTIIPDNPNNYATIKAGSSGYTPTGGPAPSYGKDDENTQAGSFTLGFIPGEGAPPFYGKREPGLEPFGEPEIKNFFSAMFSYADEHRRPREIIWDNCWRLYNNQYDWSQKAWWQHRAPIPKVRASVDRAVALFRKTLLRMNPWYGVQAESKLGRTKGRYTMLLTDYWFDQSNIHEEMMNAFKTGLVTSVAALKIWWMRVRDFKPVVTNEIKEIPTYEFGIQTGSRREEQRNAKLEQYFKGKLGVVAVNPRNLWVIPGTNGKGIIERTQVSLQEIESLVEIGVYDKEAVKRLRNQICGPTETAHDTAQQTVEGLANANQYLRMVDLYHYWGDIFTPQGVLVKCDAHFTLANKEILIRKPQDNPFYHKEHPYVIGSPYSIPFSTYNRGMVEDVADIAEAITEMANLIADGALFDAMKAFAIDIDQLDDPNEARQGVYPGKTFLRKSGSAVAPNEQLVQTVDVGKVPAEAMNMVNLFEKYLQEGSYVNEWVGGQSAKGSARTLGEVNIKTQSALEGLDESARNLEITTIEPTLEKVARVIYQYQENFTLPRLVENYPQLSIILQQMSAAERYSMMIGDYAFKVRGMSIMIDRQQKIGELKELLQLLSYIPGFIERLNPDAALEEVLMPMGWDPAKLLLNPGMMGVSLPSVGAQPATPPPMLPPPGGPVGTAGGMVPGGTSQTPMARRSAEDGARYGGARDNPAARGGNPAARTAQPQRNGGPPSGGLPPQLMQSLQLLMQNMTRGGR